MDALLACLSFLAGFTPLLSIAASSAVLACLVAALSAAAVAGNNKVRPERTPLDLPVLAFMGAWLIASLAGMDPGRSLGKVLSQTRFLLFYLLAWTAGGRYRENAFKGYLWGGAVATAYGFLQAAGAAFHGETLLPGLFSLGGVDGAYFGLRAGRIHGAVHPLTYAELILPFFFFGVGFLLEADGRRKIAGAVGWTLAAGTALLLSQSRGPWLGAAAGAGLLFLLHPCRGRLVLPLALIAGVVLLSPGLRGRAETLSQTRNDVSASDRFVLWNNTWQVIRRHPLLGVGPGRLKQAVDAHRAEDGFLPTPRGKDGDAHNQYLQFMAERGVPGLASFLWLLGAVVAAAWKKVKASEDGGIDRRWVSWGLLAFFAAFPLINLTERVFDDAEPVLVFWALASLLVRTPGGAAGGSGPGRS
jgi:O-antigen ligase